MNALDSPGSGPCPLTADAASHGLGGTWTVTSLPSGGCNYSQGSRTILISEVPAPKDKKGRAAALAQTRKPCDVGSTEVVSAVGEAFVCRQGTLVEAATIAGGRLVVVCTAAGTDPAQLPEIRTSLRTLLAQVDS
jgi:hypothetical protein